MARSARVAKSGVWAARVAMLVLASVAGTVGTVAQPLGDFEQRGIRLGAFNLFSELSVSLGYTDNVFVVPSEGITVGPLTVPKDSDFFTLIRPQLLLETNTQRHNFYTVANAAIARYDTYGVQDYEDWTIEAGGRYDVTRTFNVTGFLGYDNLHEDLTDPDRRALTQSSDYDRFRAGLGVRQTWARSFADYRFRFTRRDYDTREVGGVDLNAGRDFDSYDNRLRVGFRPYRDYNLFVEARHRYENYENLPAPARNRDQQSMTALVGTSVDLARGLKGEFSIGVEYATFDDGITSDQVGFAFDGGLDWTVTPRTVLGFDASQSFEGTDVIGASGRQVTSFALSASHRLTPQFVLSADGGLEFDDFQGVERKDDTYFAGLSATYTFNRYLSLDADYSFETRKSDVRLREYSQNEFFLRLVGRY